MRLTWSIFQEVPPPCALLQKVSLRRRISLCLFFFIHGSSSGAAFCLSVWKNIFFQFSSCLWWEGMISSTYSIMAGAEQFLFLIEAFITIMVLNKCDLRLFTFVVFWVILFSSRTLTPLFFQMKFYTGLKYRKQLKLHLLLFKWGLELAWFPPNPEAIWCSWK